MMMIIVSNVIKNAGSELTNRLAVFNSGSYTKQTSGSPVDTAGCKREQFLKCDFILCGAVRIGDWMHKGKEGISSFSSLKIRFIFSIIG